MQYLAVIEKTSNNFSAYLPDIPGCVATGATMDEVKFNLRKAMEMHIRGLREDGEPIPRAESKAEYLAVIEMGNGK